MLPTLTWLRQLRECMHWPGGSGSQRGWEQHGALCGHSACRGSSRAPKNPRSFPERPCRELLSTLLFTEPEPAATGEGRRFNEKLG